MPQITAEVRHLQVKYQRSKTFSVQFAGDLHDRATYRYYWGLVQQAKLSGQNIDEKVEAAFF